MRLKLYLNQGASSAALAVTLMASVGLFDQAQAQAQSGAGQLEEIVVTARKQEESLNSIPHRLMAPASVSIGPK